MDLSLVRLSHRNGPKMRKNYEQQISKTAETQISEAIKIISYNLIIMYFISISFHTSSIKTIPNE